MIDGVDGDMNVLIVDVQLVKIFITWTLQKIMNTVRCVDRKLNNEKMRDSDDRECNS